MTARSADGRRPAGGAIAGMFFLSLATIGLEITLTRIFSFTIWYHYAFFVIAIALLGLGASGVLVSLVGPRLVGREEAAAAAGAGVFGLGTWAALALTARAPLDPLALGRDPGVALLLTVHLLALALPFLGAGFAVALNLQSYVSAVGSLYWADLCGAALGAILPLAVLEPLGAPGLAALCAAVAALAGLGFASRAPATARRAALAVAVLLMAALPLAPRLLAVTLGPSKGIRGWLDPAVSPNGRLAFTRWHPLARVDVVENSAPVTWTMHPTAGPPPQQHQIILDGDAATPILNIQRPYADYDILGFVPGALPAHFLRPDSVLVIGVGGGLDLLTALHAGATHVEGVEINPVTCRIMTGRYRSFSGDIYRDPRVRLHVGEGRSFVRTTPARYDLVQLSLIDTFAATASGAYSLSESYLYTVEAFEDYLNHLTDDGAVAITRFLHRLPREILRLCAVARAALDRRGTIDPARHFLVAASGQYATVLVAARPFTDEAVASFARAAAERRYPLIYVPGAEPRNPIAELILSPDPQATLARFPVRLDAVTDDRPFFFQFGRFRDARPFAAPTSRDELIAPSGHSLLVTVLAVTSAVAVAMILLPLAVLGRRRRGGAGRRDAGGGPGLAELRLVAYFVGLGLAFILVEIAVMQQFALVLGHPTYAVSVVLFALLLASGTGSLVSGRLLGDDERRLGAAVAAVALMLLAEAALAGKAFALLLAWPWAGRAAAAVAWVAAPGFGMGMLLPTGVRVMSRRGAPNLIGWAFGANGFASVVGSALSVLLAILIGFRATVAIAALLYLGAGAALGRGRGPGSAGPGSAWSPSTSGRQGDRSRI